MTPLSPADEARFWSKVDRSGGPDGCWLWMAGRFTYGYGNFNLRRRAGPAHRVAWTLTHGPIPDGLDVLHRCDTPPCVKATHLFLGTPADNNADRDAKGRQARGERNGAYTHPERRPRGERNGAYTHPERRVRLDGERNGRARLTVAQVRDIRARAASGGRGTQAALAREYGVGKTTIRQIVRRETWTHGAPDEGEG